MSDAIPGAPVEKRLATRAKSLLGARIHLNNRRSTLDCVVRNVSEEGARLDVVNGHLAPDEFDIVIPQRHRTYRARLAWRADGQMGIRFISPEAAPNTSASPDKLRAARAENEELRQVIRNLNLRIQALTGGIIES